MTTSIKDVKIHRKSKFKIVSIVFKITTKLKYDELTYKTCEQGPKEHLVLMLSGKLWSIFSLPSPSPHP